ncbi:MAG: methionyl-tRNA formyltransferase [Actinomycetaceae bacterium]|nr:methionyl-tRNA formyltransferase [Actinomycetaceae bacterium]
MRCIFAGTPDIALDTFRALCDSSHEVVGVLTRAPQRKGRGRTTVASPIEKEARSAGIDVATPSSLRNDDALEWIRQRRPDVIVVVAYGLMVPAEALDIPTYGWLNLHFSLLPRWRGAAPVQHAMLAGDDIQGVSVFRIDEGMDTGPLYAVDPIRVAPDQTSDHVLWQLSRHGADIMIRVLDALESGSPRAHPQRSQGVTYAPKIDRSMGHINWNLPVERVDQRIRACTAKPGAWTELPNGQIVKIGPIVMRDEDTLEPGQIRVGKHEVDVGTATRDIALVEVKPQGKNWMTADAWARGAHLEEDTRFVSSDND